MTDLHPNSQQIREIIEQAGSTFVSVKFIKKDGSEREITFNPKDCNEIKGTGKPRQNPNLFNIREVHNKETGKTVWKSFDGTRVLRISAKGRTVNFDVVGDS
jgi:cysteine synthase